MEPLAAHSEREWILIGMAECCATKGYEQTAVADICAAAGVSRRSFDRLYAGPEDCLAGVVESLLAEAWLRIEAVRSPAKPWAATVRDGVRVLLDLLAERPAFARAAAIETPVAVGRGQEIYAAGKAAALAYLERGSKQADVEEGIPASAGRAALAGAEVLVSGRILAGKAEGLAELAPDVIYLLTVPYLGQAEAARAAEAQPTVRHLRAVA